MASKKMLETIKELKDAEATLIMSAKKCSNARRTLEKAAGLTPAPSKGKDQEAIVVHIANRRRQNLLRKGLK